VTVGVAAICTWNYARDGTDLGNAIITLTDRMITFGDSEYEPAQQKFGQLTKSTVLLIAGEYSIHSQAIMETRRQLGSPSNATVYEVAQIYGHALQKIKLRMAENEILAPLGLNSDSFISQQSEMSPVLVDRLSMELQHHDAGAIEALIAGMDDGSPSLYYLDSRGTAHCFNDIGFAAVGVGAWHARSRLMQGGYFNRMPYLRALAMTYAAKKAAEVAPGVGRTTDVHIVFKTGIETLTPAIQRKLDALFEEYQADVREVGNRTIDKLNSFVSDKRNWGAPSTVAKDGPSSPTEPAPQPSQSAPGPLE